MPLASSRIASQKRAAAVIAEKKEQERRKRLSLPSTCDSSTVVTESKARRRQSLRRQSSISKENSVPNAPKSPGVTPYWQVAEERGDMSPPLTRSAKKNKPPRHGAVLQFSPPNQAENARREARQIAERLASRGRRVQEARNNGQLLVFSPTHRDPADLASSDNSMSGKDFEVSSEASVNQSSLTETHLPSASHDADLFKSMMEKLDAKLNSVGTADKELFDLKIGALNEKIVQIEQEKNQVETKLQEATEKLVSEKENLLVEKTRLESEIDASKREAGVRISMLQEAHDKLQQHFDNLQSEKSELLDRIRYLEKEVASAQTKVEESKNHLNAMKDDSRAELDKLVSENESMKNVNMGLRQKLESLEAAKKSSDAKISDYETCIANLESQLRASTKELDSLKEQLDNKNSTESELASKLEEYRCQIQELESENEKLVIENEDERKSFQQLNEQSMVAFENLQRESESKDAKIGELFKQLGDLEQKLSVERKKGTSALQSIESQLEEKDARIAELDEALRDATDQIRQVNSAKESLERQVEDEVNKLKGQLEQYEEYLQAEKRQKKDALAQVTELERRLNESDSDAKKRIKSLEHERDEALVNMQGFNDRETELYRRLQESDRIRKSLHARVMQLMGNIRVFVRVRPPLPHEIESEKARLEAEADGKKRKRSEEYTLFRFPGIYENQTKKQSKNSDDASKNIVELTEPYKDRGGLSERRQKHRYAFDGVFSPQQGQEEIWEATEPLIQCAIDGFNVTIFAYGQTGAGKTYTMLGGEGSEQGIIGRSVNMLFAKKAEIESLSKGESSVDISVELLEIYNEQVRDLLAPNGGPNGREVPLKVTSEEVVGNVKVDTTSEDEVMKVLKLAQKRRCVKATSSNSESSRSHMLFTIHFVSTSKDGIKSEGKLNICDLAGSERLSKSGANNVGGALLKETQNINKSLSTLSNVIEKLQAGDSVIPYRESKLTFLLKNSLGGNSKTLAIVCCNPLASHYSESSNSLKFAEKVNKVDLKQTKANVTY